MTTLGEYVPFQLQLETSDMIFVGFESALMLFGTIMTLVVLIATARQTMTSSSIHIMTMCVADFMLCSTLFVCTTYNLSLKSFALSVTGCYTLGYLVVLTCYMSVLALVSFTIDRYCAIVYQRPMSLKSAYLLSFGMISVSLLIPTISILLPERSTLFCVSPSKAICTVAWWFPDEHHLWLYLISLVSLFLSVIFMILCYTRIYLIFKRQQLSQNLSALRSTQEKSVRSNKSMPAKEKQLMIKAIAVTGLFCFTWSPYFIMICTEMILQKPVDPVLDQICVLCAIANSALNPVFLCLFDVRTRSHLFQLLGWTIKKPENQSRLSWENVDV
ncbi:hypothetical protein EDD86DRAFT_200565 [Gorgonomyces haynaldii]|nr:hypothetical protein EDD86DRAFT_200565 [Gorgonomyces haynaldii]